MFSGGSYKFSLYSDGGSIISSPTLFVISGNYQRPIYMAVKVYYFSGVKLKLQIKF
jgi:hypothetical protein